MCKKLSQRSIVGILKVAERPILCRDLDSKTFRSFYYLKEELVSFCRKKVNGTTIDRQFEYNTYIRDFFADNTGMSLADAICCWKYKKSIMGHNRYERTDLIALRSDLGT